MAAPVWLLSLLLAAGLSLGPVQAAEKPHIVIFISDDHGYLDSPVYGSRAVRTPNMERLAGRGTTFANAFVGSPACAPSRAILLTGLMSARNGAEANHSRVHEHLRMLPEYMEELGYQVAFFGKVGHGRDPRLDRYRIPAVVRHGPLDSDLDPHVAARYIADNAGGDKPLLVIAGSFSPHVYWPPNDGYDAAEVELPPTFVDTPETREYRAMYYTDVSLMDQRLGVVLDAAERHLGENTAFFYTSDHGAQWPFAKWTLYDAGIRTPLIAAWPEVIASGARSDALVSFVDLLPTLVDLGGGPAPVGLDGASFARVLRGVSADHREHVFATHSGDGKMNVYPSRAVRTKTHKLILNLFPDFEHTTHIDKGNNQDGLKFWRSWERAARSNASAAAIVDRYHRRARIELYDVKADPHELRNLAGDPSLRSVEDQLLAELERWMEIQGDQGRYFNQPRLLAE